MIRKSIIEDAEYFIKIKERLPLCTQDEQSEKGGFLLGTNLETYQFYIHNGLCFTALANEEVVGFGIILPNELIKQSALWEKRKSVDWSLDLSRLENSNVAYIEQLAFLKGHRKLTIILSYELLHTAFENGAELILTTTVREPVINLSAVPMIKAVEGKLIGNIDEVYPIVGDINSDIYLMDKAPFYQSIKKRRIYDLIVS